MELLKELEHTIDCLTIDQMLELAKKRVNKEKLRFRATSPTGSMEGEILDCFFGLLRFDEQPEGFVEASEFRFNNDVKWKLL